MKVAATLTAQVMESIGNLPGIATLDWCDRASLALAHAHQPSTVAIAVGQFDAKGFFTTLEVSGIAAASGQHAPAAPTDEPPPELRRIRDTFREGEWLGWNFGPAGTTPFIATASGLGLLRRGEGPLSRRWSTVEPAEVILAALPLTADADGRWMIVEFALKPGADRDTTVEQAVLTAVLPYLARRFVSAIGAGAVDKRSWLTPREEAVLWQLVSGKKVPQIAEELHRSVYTVHDHVKSLHRKLGANNRGQLVARALGHIGPLPTAPPEVRRAATPKRTPRLTGVRG